MCDNGLVMKVAMFRKSVCIYHQCSGWELPLQALSNRFDTTDRTKYTNVMIDFDTIFTVCTTSANLCYITEISYQSFDKRISASAALT